KGVVGELGTAQIDHVAVAVRGVAFRRNGRPLLAKVVDDRFCLLLLPLDLTESIPLTSRQGGQQRQDEQDREPQTEAAHLGDKCLSHVASSFALSEHQGGGTSPSCIPPRAL